MNISPLNIRKHDVQAVSLATVIVAVALSAAFTWSMSSLVRVAVLSALGAGAAYAGWWVSHRVPKALQRREISVFSVAMLAAGGILLGLNLI